MSEQKEGPFKTLGRQLKSLRARAKESLAEVSGAVEINTDQLVSFELGQSRPTEEVLLLLINHLDAKDDEAVRLWEMAGYGMSRTAVQQPNNLTNTTNSDAKILFTDVVDITVNNYGVVMNFMQAAEPATKPNSIARVGMSREHAKSVLQILQLTLNQTEQNTATFNSKKTDSTSQNKNT